MTEVDDVVRLKQAKCSWFLICLLGFLANDFRRKSVFFYLKSLDNKQNYSIHLVIHVLDATFSIRSN